MMGVPKVDLKTMILENTQESVLKAKEILGLPADARVGLRRVPGFIGWEPVIEKGEQRWYVGDEVLPA